MIQDRRVYSPYSGGSGFEVWLGLLFFLIAAPEDAIGAHLNVMARLSYLMKSEENREKLLQAASPGDVLALIDNIG